MRFWMLIPIAVAAILGHSVSAHAIEVRTYRFVDQDERRFNFGGGLVGGGFDAKLEGSIEIRQEQVNVFTITRFDVSITEIDVTHPGVGPFTSGSLRSRLFSDPLGLSGKTLANAPNILIFSSSTIPSTPMLFDDGIPRTSIRLDGWDQPSARVSISSYPGYFLDSPNYGTRDPGFTVESVPEPMTGGLATVIFWAAISRRGLLFQRPSTARVAARS